MRAAYKKLAAKRFISDQTCVAWASSNRIRPIMNQMAGLAHHCAVASSQQLPSNFRKESAGLTVVQLGRGNMRLRDRVKARGVEGSGQAVAKSEPKEYPLERRATGHHATSLITTCQKYWRWSNQPWDFDGMYSSRH